MTDALDAMDRFRILCPHNVGEFGTLQINHVREMVLRRKVHSVIKNRSVKQMIMINTKQGILGGDLSGFVYRGVPRAKKKAVILEPLSVIRDAMSQLPDTCKAGPGK